MSIDEQQKIREKQYAEAIRYMDNAKEMLKKAGKEGHFYNDKKYVRVACGTAYSGVLIALDTYLLFKGIKKTKGRKSIEYYCDNVGSQDKKLLKYLDSVYTILHLSGYYDGTLDARAVLAGFDSAYKIIDKIRPLEQAA
ncbi:hypothetical protein AGMMS50262_03510 [Bacteroidia bacterium]|nr:hypothetical protein AGMMS50262_03510 [Bacteroidia bacterium]